MTTCCQRIALTPRSIKRLVNVLKLMKIFWFRAEKGNSIKEREQPRNVKQATMSLLALSSAYPEVMRDAFVHLETLYHKKNGKIDLFVALNSVKLPPGTATEIASQLQKFKDDVAALKAVISDDQNAFGHITLSELKFSTFSLIRSFSFVGDPVFWTDGEESAAIVTGQSQAKSTTEAKRGKKQLSQK